MNLIESQKEEDENVFIKNKRRNILFTKKIYNQKLWTFNFNSNLEQVLDLISPIDL